ncbi:MAG: prepilin peptidase CpaA [Sphingomonadales bacterium]|jgi:prepilin peptidase CpaA|nr:prepilin peptidase CpaA [Sphingomonadales bacterium]
MQGGLSWLFIALLAAALLLAAVGDWRSRTIPNRLNAGIALLAIPYWWSVGLSFWPDVLLQIGLGAAVFGLFAIAFRFGAMGGGDVKMAAALALWLPVAGVVKLLVIMSIAGGVLTVAMLAAHRIAKSAGQPEIPYGIAIAFGGFWLIGERFLNQFV